MKEKIGVILINTGTPLAPTYKEVRRYLSQFLSDPRVIDIPWIYRFALLQFIILPFRSRTSAKAYQKVWMQSGSPLLVHSRAYEKKLAEELGADYKVVLGMRYGNPSIKEAWEQVRNCSRVLIFPLFPHYASSSTGSALEEIYSIAKKEWNLPALKSVEAFFQDVGFIQALSQHIRKELTHISWDHLVFSFHGLPQHHIEKSGCQSQCPQNNCVSLNSAPFCYRAQCFASVRDLVKELNLSDAQYSVGFQSRLGRRPWIKPYFDELLPTLRQKGIRNLAVVCPSFVADCLETVEEIRIRALETWKELGGENLTLIPCLNDDIAWVKASAHLLKNL